MKKLSILLAILALLGTACSEAEKKADANAEAKTEAKAEVKAEPKADAKPEAKTEAKADAGAVPAGMKVLKLDVPPLQIEGTPVPVKMDNLDSSKAPNPQPNVPADVTNIALKKKVTSSDDFPLTGELHQITDGDKAGASGSYMEIGGGLQWVQIDLEKTSEIFAIAVWNYHSQERAYKDVVVQISDDAAFEKGVTTVFNADHDNSAKLGAGKDKAWIQTNEGKLIVLKEPLKARYVRLYSDGNTTNELNSYIEVEVYGR